MSERLVDQSLRNRVMEAMLSLVEWQADLETVGFAEYFEMFFDFFPYEGDPDPNSAMTPEESAAVAQVHKLMIEALNATPRTMKEAKFIATGWPQRIAPVAEQALKLMLERGRFSEDHEEDQPSKHDGWP